MNDAETFERIFEIAEACIHATMLPGLPAEIHLQGLKGCMEQIRGLAKDRLGEWK